ncbi:MAG: hypothetical protein Q9161_002345 [Pseudevernia consocians]
MRRLVNSRISQATEPFPLKKLPREIRDQIYDHVFEVDKVTATTYHTFNWIPTPTESTQLASCRNPQIMLALLLTDHEILREGLLSFYGHRILSIGSSVYPHASVQFLKGIGRQRLNLLRIVEYSVMLSSHKYWDSSGQWHQTFWDLSRSEWRATFQYLKSACRLQRLKIDLGRSALTRRGLTPNEWAELETCLVGIKGKVDLSVCNGCKVFVRENPVECEGMTTEMASYNNHWTCKKGETEWSPMESVYLPEWRDGKPSGVLKRSYEGPRGACSVHKGK